MKILARANAWQLFFILITGIGVSQFAILKFLVAVVPEKFTYIDWISPSIIFVGLWYLSAGIAVSPVAESTALRKLKVTWIVVIFSWVSLSLISHGSISVSSTIQVILAIAFLFGWLYCIWFIAAGMASFEADNDAAWSTIGMDFLRLWVWPVGIWNVQPRIRKIACDQEERL